MIFKERDQSTEFQILKQLHLRLNSESCSRQYLNLLKGYKGELMFDALTEKLLSDCLVLNNLLLKMNLNTFQIDTLIITANKLYLFDIKNLEGDYIYKEEGLYKSANFEISNPITQLNRCASLFRQLLQSLDYKQPTEAHVVFINPRFTLYQAPTNMPLIFPAQVERFLKNLGLASSKLQEKHVWLANKLVSLHSNHFPFIELPEYDLSVIKKGLTCMHCDSFQVVFRGHKLDCDHCGEKEGASAAIMRGIKEFRLLFPETKLTATLIQDWCQIPCPFRRIRRILKSNFVVTGTGKWTYYQ